MLQIPKKIDYAVQLLRYLHTAEDVVSLRDVSTSLDIPFLFLQQIAQELRSQGYIEAKRGASGGYKLAKDIQDLTIHDVMVLFNERVEVVACATDETACHKSKSCTVKHVWKGVHHNLEQIFSSTYVLG
jgi:Rrf2 family protein